MQNSMRWRMARARFPSRRWVDSLMPPPHPSLAFLPAQSADILSPLLRPSIANFLTFFIPFFSLTIPTWSTEVLTVPTPRTPRTLNMWLSPSYLSSHPDTDQRWLNSSQQRWRTEHFHSHLISLKYPHDSYSSSSCTCIKYLDHSEYYQLEYYH